MVFFFSFLELVCIKFFLINFCFLHFQLENVNGENKKIQKIIVYRTFFELLIRVVLEIVDFFNLFYTKISKDGWLYKTIELFCFLLPFVLLEFFYLRTNPNLFDEIIRANEQRPAEQINQDQDHEHDQNQYNQQDQVRLL